QTFTKFSEAAHLRRGGRGQVDRVGLFQAAGRPGTLDIATAGRIRAVRCSRSSLLSVTTYFFTAISFLAINPLRQQRRNHRVRQTPRNQCRGRLAGRLGREVIERVSRGIRSWPILKCSSER